MKQQILNTVLPEVSEQEKILHDSFQRFHFMDVS